MKVFYMLMMKMFLICKSMSICINEMYDIIFEIWLKYLIVVMIIIIYF